MHMFRTYVWPPESETSKGEKAPWANYKCRSYLDCQGATTLGKGLKVRKLKAAMQDHESG